MINQILGRKSNFVQLSVQLNHGHSSNSSPLGVCIVDDVTDVENKQSQTYLQNVA